MWGAAYWEQKSGKFSLHVTPLFPRPIQTEWEAWEKRTDGDFISRRCGLLLCCHVKSCAVKAFSLARKLSLRSKVSAQRLLSLTRICFLFLSIYLILINKLQLWLPLGSWMLREMLLTRPSLQQDPKRRFPRKDVILLKPKLEASWFSPASRENAPRRPGASLGMEQAAGSSETVAGYSCQCLSRRELAESVPGQLLHKE